MPCRIKNMRGLASIMSRIIQRACLLGVATIIGSLSVASAQVTMVLTGPTSGPVLDGVYISPYTATINGVPTTVICDDFSTDISFGYSWMANKTNLASINSEVAPDSTLKFDNGLPIDPNPGPTAAQQRQDYTVAAYLATEIIGAQQSGNVTAQGQYSYALWSLFEGSAVQSWLASYHDAGTWNAAQADLASARSFVNAHALTPGSYANVDIYSSTPLAASQEFLAVSAPEPTAISVLAVDLLGLTALVVLFRRRIFPASN
jgi:hypothetical protein